MSIRKPTKLRKIHVLRCIVAHAPSSWKIHSPDGRSPLAYLLDLLGGSGSSLKQNPHLFGSNVNPTRLRKPYEQLSKNWSKLSDNGLFPARKTHAPGAYKQLSSDWPKMKDHRKPPAWKMESPRGGSSPAYLLDLLRGAESALKQNPYFVSLNVNPNRLRESHDQLPSNWPQIQNNGLFPARKTHAPGAYKQLSSNWPQMKDHRKPPAWKMESPRGGSSPAYLLDLLRGAENALKQNPYFVGPNVNLTRFKKPYEQPTSNWPRIHIFPALMMHAPGGISPPASLSGWQGGSGSALKLNPYFVGPNVNPRLREAYEQLSSNWPKTERS
ncbi:hypothetical protein GE061_007519 [Apolygus lucorum]|uniref:Uncharacterized protein n=1 Tax=Apolygus lucorum TaxID=248454 RepID=A0A8S9WS70_APOLU|nr:hypothetical protein GE061_007519 [Apolygus lucorum]